MRKNEVLKLTLFVLLLALTTTATAQLAAVRKVIEKGKINRNEIVIPKVGAYNVYKADFHIHTIYSDGDITPAMRVDEAFADGLDIIAITDHMEYRRIEREMYRYMKDYILKHHMDIRISTSISMTLDCLFVRKMVPYVISHLIPFCDNRVMVI